MKLHISPNLSLPRDTVTSTIVVYGGKGMGKTNLGDVIVEELSKCHLKWSALDPLGVWYGVRHSRDGKSPGIECVILGGSHGDMPIEPTGGAVVADIVVDEPGNVVIDFSRKPTGEMWSIGEKIRFVTDYTKRVFQRQGGLVKGRRREPFMQILDEAARYIPQIIPHGATNLAECLGAWETLVEEGRNIGIGVLLLTQRSARMAKSVSEVADAMFSFRIVGPNSIKAVTDWLGEHVPKERVHQHIEVLRSLERGRCLVVSPGWLQFEGVIDVRARETFDSSATPKPGERATRVTGKAAKPDLGKYLERMKETIQKAEANDPKKLQSKIRELQIQLTKKQPAPTVSTKVAKVSTKISEAEIRRVLQEELEPWRDFAQQVRRRLVEAEKLLADAAESGAMLVMKLGSHRKTHGDIPDYPKGNVQAFDAKPVQKKLKEQAIKFEPIVPLHAPRTFFLNEQHETRPRPVVIAPSTSNGLPEGEREVLKAIAKYSEGVARDQLSVLTGYKRSTRDAYIARMRPKGYIEDRDGRIHATDAGIAALGEHYETLPPNGQQLQHYWLAKLPEGEKKILEILLEHNSAISRDSLQERTGFKRSTRDAYLSRMTARRIVKPAGPGQVKAVDEFFL